MIYSMETIKITTEQPPQWILDAVKPWGVDFGTGKVAFTVGDTVHIGCGVVPKILGAHEAIHIKQQVAIGWEAWWKKYISDEAFRIEQEVDAYRGQYAFVVSKIKSQNTRFNYLRQFAEDLGSGMYGKHLSLFEAMRIIRGGKI